MSDQYYIRVRGEVKGPLRREQIVTQIRRKRLGRHHELSTDAVTWQKAGDIPDLFEPLVAIRERPTEEEPETESPPSESKRAQQQVNSDGAPPSRDGDWYYAKGGNKLGPVPASDIQMWLSSGNLSPSDLVWHEDFENWLPVGDLPQFAGAVKSRGQNSSSYRNQPSASFWEIVMGTSKAAMLPRDAIHKYPNLTRYIQIAEASLRIAFVVALVVNLASCFYYTIEAVRAKLWTFAAGSVIAALGLGLFAWLIFLSLMAALEFIRVVIKIEDNTSS